MKNALIAILLCGVAVAACNANRADKQEVEKAAQISIDSADAASNIDGSTNDAGVNIKADMESGEVELQLPGGLAGKVKIPAGLQADAKFDLDGLGRYPGSKLSSVDVQGRDANAGDRSVVVLGFTAPGTAAHVADWYGKAMADKGRFSGRSGNTLTGSTEDGDRMVIAVDDGAGGVARGRITITDKKS